MALSNIPSHLPGGRVPFPPQSGAAEFANLFLEPVSLAHQRIPVSSMTLQSEMGRSATHLSISLFRKPPDLLTLLIRDIPSLCAFPLGPLLPFGGRFRIDDEEEAGEDRSDLASVKPAAEKLKPCPPDKLGTLAKDGVDAKKDMLSRACICASVPMRGGC